MSHNVNEVVCQVAVPNPAGLHARPVMRFVDLASKYRSAVWVTNTSKGDERVDGKSAMQMMLLEATQGSLLRIEVTGDDAQAAADALSALVRAGFPGDGAAEAPD